MIDYIASLNASPQLREHLQKKNDERSFAAHQFYTSIGNGLLAAFAWPLSLVSELRRKHRETAVHRELSGLSDIILFDIGLGRNEIGQAAKIVSEGGSMSVQEVRGQIRAQELVEASHPKSVASTSKLEVKVGPSIVSRVPEQVSRSRRRTNRQPWQVEVAKVSHGDDLAACCG